MRKISSKKRILAILLSVMMVTLGIPLQAQATSSDWSQLANEHGNEEWIYGNLNPNKSIYVEGMSVPQRLILENIDTNVVEHYVDFEHQFTKSGHYAYDFITSWNQAKDAASDKIGQAWQDSWIEESLAYSVDISVPTNNYADDQEDAYEDIYGDRTVRIYSSEPVTKAAITMNNTLQGNVNSDSTLGFTVSWEGNAEDVIILYASHIAIGDDTDMGWGLGMGAGGISGSPYHNYLVGSSEWSGNSARDNQLKINENVIGISGVKWGDYDGDGKMDDGEEGLKGWQIWADLDNDGILDSEEPLTMTLNDGSYTLNVLLPKNGNQDVKVYEIQKDGFTQTFPSDKLYHEFKLKSGDDDITDINFGNFEKVPRIEVTKTASPSTMDEPGGIFTYTYIVTNTGNVPVTLTSVVDDVIGNITLPADKYLLPGESTENMTGTKSYTTPGEYPNIVTATAVDDDEIQITDTDDASVEVIDILPSITVTKVAKPTSLPKGGGVFTYKFVVTNNGDVPVTVTSVHDDVIGEITLPNDVELEPGESTVEMTGTKTHTQSGTHTNTVTAKAEDEEENEDTATASASVSVSDSDASITVTKTPSPLTMAEPGGEFTYTYIVTNNGNVDVTVTSVIDDIIGVITLPEDVVLAPGESTVAMTGKHTYTDDGTYLNEVIVTATVGDDDPITAKTTATVTVTDTKPIISVTKTASPTSMIEPGGLFTFTYIVKNTGTVPITVTSVVDNVIGEITLPEDVELAPGESTVAMTGTKSYTEAGTYSNTVIVTAEDDDSNITTATADATVTVRLPDEEEPEEPEDPEEPEEPDDDEEEEEDIIPIDDPEVPLSNDPIPEPDVPEVVIEDTAVPEATLPNTGSVLNTTILMILGLLLIMAGIVLNRKSIKG